MLTCKMTRRNDEAQVAEWYMLPGADITWGSSWGGSQQGRAALQHRSTACDHCTPCPPKMERLQLQDTQNKETQQWKSDLA